MGITFTLQMFIPALVLIVGTLLISQYSMVVFVYYSVFLQKGLPIFFIKCVAFLGLR